MTREEKLLKIFEIADKNRNLEIKLYWERSKYFFGFITALLASVLGLAAFLIYKYESLNNSNYNALILGSIGLVILSTLLLFFSVGFWLSHKASKFWQENWENILGVLERKIFGDDFVYSVILFRKELVKKEFGNAKERNLEFDESCLFHLTKPFFISPSKINANLSIVITIASYLLFVFSFGLLITTLELPNKNEFSLKLWSVFMFLNIFTILLLVFFKLKNLLIAIVKKYDFLISFCFISTILLLFVPFLGFVSMCYILYLLFFNFKVKEIFLFFLFIFVTIIFLIPYSFHNNLYILLKSFHSLNIFNNVLYWLYLFIILSLYIFIRKSINDFAKERKKVIDNYIHKYLITFNIIDDKEYKNGNFRLEKLYFDELNNGKDK